MSQCPIPATAPARRALPDLATPIGLAGTMRHAEVAGALSLETSVVVATMIFSIGER